MVDENELEESQQTPVSYSVGDLCRDLNVIESMDANLEEEAQNPANGIRAIGKNSPEFGAWWNRLQYRQVVERLKSEFYDRQGIDEVQLAVEREWGERLQSRHLLLLRARYCDEFRSSLGSANALPVVEFGKWLRQSRVLRTTPTPDIPGPIRDSLSKFKADHPDPSRVVFLIMQFGQTKAHLRTVDAIRSIFDEHGLKVLRADDKEYHDHLLFNVQTYMHGCGAGVALFERIDSDNFNPNVSLEVGYMMAQGKPVCLLKERTLRSLPTDLVGTLYKDFDIQDPVKTLRTGVSQWVNDRGLSKKN